MTDIQEHLLLSLTELDFSDRESYLRWCKLWALRYEGLSKAIRNRKAIHRTAAAELGRLCLDTNNTSAVWNMQGCVCKAWAAVLEGKRHAREALEVRAASKAKSATQRELNGRRT